MEGQQIVLADHFPHPSGDEVPPQQPAALAPPDRGKDAYLVLAGCFALDAIVWGTTSSYGVFRAHYATNDQFTGDATALSAVSTTASGMMLLLSPAMTLAVRRWPRLRRPALCAGLGIIVLSLIAASFARDAGTLLATQGVMYGFGGLVLYSPLMHLVDEWFVARKGLAYGIVWTGSGSAGAAFPFVSQWMIDSFGSRVALCTWAVVYSIIGIPALIVLKPRLPLTMRRQQAAHADLSLFKQAPLWYFEIGTIMQAMAYFLPPLWIPRFAQELDLPSFSGPLALCLVNIGACIGYTLQGLLVDAFDVIVPILVATLGSALSVFIFWGLTTTQAMLYVFALTWGLSGGGYAACFSGFSKVISRASSSKDNALVISLMCAGMGVASLLTGPVSEQLFESSTWSTARYAYGTRYGSIVVFAGVSAAFGGTACLCRLLKLL